MAANRTPAQWFCLLGGALLVARGLVGLAVLDRSFDLPGEGWHHLVHLASGAVLIAGARARGTAVALATAFGVFYVGVAAVGIIDGDDVLGVIAADAVDKTFHSVLGLTSLGCGIASLGSTRAARRAA